jgi:hypothetical protein
MAAYSPFLFRQFSEILRLRAIFVIPTSENRTNYSEEPSALPKRRHPLYYQPSFLLEDYARLVGAKCSDESLLVVLTRLRAEYCRLLAIAKGKRKKSRAVDALLVDSPIDFWLLVDQLRWHSYAVALSFAKQSERRWGPRFAWRLDELIGESHLSVIVAVRRLAQNDRSDLTRFVQAVIWGCLRGLNKAELPDIVPPASTNSTRAAGDKHPTLKRSYPSTYPGRHHRHCDQHALDFPACGRTVNNSAGEPSSLPSRLHRGNSDAEAIEVHDFVAQLPVLDQQIVQKRIDGDTLPVIAESLSLTPAQVRYRLRCIGNNAAINGFAPTTGKAPERSPGQSALVPTKSQCSLASLQTRETSVERRHDDWAGLST